MGFLITVGSMQSPSRAAGGCGCKWCCYTAVSTPAHAVKLKQARGKVMLTARCSPPAGAAGGVLLRGVSGGGAAAAALRPGGGHGVPQGLLAVLQRGPRQAGHGTLSLSCPPPPPPPPPPPAPPASLCKSSPQGYAHPWSRQNSCTQGNGDGQPHKDRTPPKAALCSIGELRTPGCCCFAHRSSPWERSTASLEIWPCLEVMSVSGHQDPIDIEFERRLAVTNSAIEQVCRGHNQTLSLA